MILEKKVNLLLLDDDDIRMDPMVDFLQLAGFNVHRAHHPEAAWSLLKRQNPFFGLLVLDLIMPPRGCYDLATCPEVERCGEIFLADLRDADFANPAITESENKQRNQAKARYGSMPVVVLTARNPNREGLGDRLRSPPLNALRVDRKMPADLESYSRKLMAIARKASRAKEGNNA